MRTGVTNVSSRPAQGPIKLAFASRGGPPTQIVSLPVGEWLVEWPGAARVEPLRVKAGSNLHVALATASGACLLEADSCRLKEGFREQRIRITEGHLP